MAQQQAPSMSDVVITDPPAENVVEPPFERTAEQQLSVVSSAVAVRQDLSRPARPFWAREAVAWFG